MVTNYTPPATDTNEEEDIFTQAFTANNNPAEVATSAAQREYSRILAESRAQERTTQESYSDMYAKMKQSSFRRAQAAPSQGFTGGMAAQQQSAMSAAEMAELGALGRSQEQALRDIRTSRLSAASNAMIVGQQQADYASMLQDRAVGVQTEIERVIASEEYDDDAKQRILKTFGMSDTEIKTLLGIEDEDGTASLVSENYWEAVLGAQAGGFALPRTQATDEEE